MRWITARTRITIGLACMQVSVLCCAMIFGLVPEPNSGLLEGRKHLCETIAICSSDYIGRGELRRVESLLEAITQRNDQLLSAGIREADGLLISQIGDHDESWKPGQLDLSTDSQVLVPIRAGQQKWGNVELRFRPMDKSGLAGIWEAPWVRLTIFASGLSYLLFFFYLGKMLQHLDPSQTVPKRVRAALDSLAEGLLVIDRQQRVVLANQAFANWVGRAPEKILGVPAASFDWRQNEQGDPLLTYPWLEALERAAPQAGKVLALQQQDQPPRMLIANASPVLGHDGQYRGVLVSFDDVTQLEMTRKDLAVAKKTAEQANRAKSDFLARMSHEIRTPMNAILGYTEVLQAGWNENEQQRHQHLATIQDSGEHLLELINDILDLSKIESGRLELEQAPCQLHELMGQVVSVLSIKAKQKGLDLRYEPRGRLPETILTDSVRLRQVIINLVGNAIKFTEQGSVTIVARRMEQVFPQRAVPQLAIDIVNTGIGMSPGALQKIFEPFSQADTTITRRFGGTGLGLSISRQLAEQLGGSVTVESEPGRGSTFTVTLDPGPLDDSQWIEVSDCQARQSVSASRAPEGDVSLPPAHILVVDDSEANRQLIQLFLRRAGVQIMTAEHGEQAVALASQHRFEVILMDMHMPVMDGFTATRRLREQGCSIPIIALTADIMQEGKEKCRAAGCTGFLAKPIKMNTLLKALRELLGSAPSPTESVPSVKVPMDTSNATNREAAAPIACRLPVEDPEIRQIVEGFVARLSGRVQDMRQAWLQRDFRELAEAGHWLKGAGETVGFPEFSAPAAQLEEAAKSATVARIETCLAEIESLADRIELTVP